MADIHILEGTRSGAGIAYRVVFHIPVPDVTNEAGISYQQAVVQAKADTKSVLTDIDSTEQAKLDSGELWEEVVTFRTHPARKDDAERLKALYEETKTRLQKEFAERFKYTGLTLSAKT